MCPAILIARLAISKAVREFCQPNFTKSCRRRSLVPLDALHTCRFYKPSMSLEEKLAKIRSPNLENQKHVRNKSIGPSLH